MPVFVKNLELLMAQRELSKRQLAARIGVSAPSLCAWWPPNSCEPKLSTLVRIASEMEVSLDWLVIGKSDKKKKTKRKRKK